jgi:hypothetical protein
MVFRISMKTFETIYLCDRANYIYSMIPISTNSYLCTCVYTYVSIELITKNYECQCCPTHLRRPERNCVIGEIV